MADKQKFIQCDCYGEGLLITKFDDEEELYFSYWRQGIDPIKLSWWMRLKLCWMVLTKGNYYEDQIIINKEKSKELDRKSTRLNSSHKPISYAVFCLKKKKRTTHIQRLRIACR